MTIVVALLALAVLAFVWRSFVEKRDRRLFDSIARRDPTALEGIYGGVPAIASLDHLEPRGPKEVDAHSPYRQAGENLGDEQIAALRRRARTALSNACWLLTSAVDEADDADRSAARGDVRSADACRMRQTQAELEALQCVFEAEDCLGSLIVRDPGQPRCFGPFYGQAERLLVKVSHFCSQAFGDRPSPLGPR